MKGGTRMLKDNFRRGTVVEAYADVDLFLRELYQKLEELELPEITLLLQEEVVKCDVCGRDGEMKKVWERQGKKVGLCGRCWYTAGEEAHRPLRIF